MGVSKIDVSIVERIAPERGPTSSADYNAVLQELINDLTQISLAWNGEVQPLLDSLPSGDINIIRENRSDSPDPFANGFDGSQVYLDLTSTSLTDNGKYYSTTDSRPYTIKESIENVQDQLNDAIQELQVKIAQVSIDSGITSRQRQAIGSRIFDPETTSSPTSIDGLAQEHARSIDQIALDISGDSSYLNGSGAQSLAHAILAQLQAIQAAHDYDSVFNTMSHGHMNLHQHRYHVTPVGALDGVNKEYYLPGTETFVAGSLRVIVNGLELMKTTDYAEKPDNRGFDIDAGKTALENINGSPDDYIWIHYDVEV
jgi:hypothetical protein